MSVGAVFGTAVALLSAAEAGSLVPFTRRADSDPRTGATGSAGTAASTGCGSGPSAATGSAGTTPVTVATLRSPSTADVAASSSTRRSESSLAAGSSSVRDAAVSATSSALSGASWASAADSADSSAARPFGPRAFSLAPYESAVDGPAVDDADVESLVPASAAAAPAPATMAAPIPSVKAPAPSHLYASARPARSARCRPVGCLAADDLHAECVDCVAMCRDPPRAKFLRCAKKFTKR